MAKSTRSGKQPAKQDPKKAPIQPAVFFAYPAGKAVPLDNSSLFEGKTFYVRCDFPDLYLAQFICDIEALGGSTNVADAWTADYIINNPPETDNQWQKDLRRRVQTEKECKSPIQRPYYWIYACHHAGEILSEEEMPKHPVFTKWDHSRRRPVPLLVYITVNLPRHGDESADDALCAAESLLESHGGLRSATRGHADVLLLNLTTASGKKFQAEAKPDQVIWSRTQFQDLAASSNSLDLGRDEEPHEIVVARTNARSVSAAAAGRRTIRKEFTAEDDDLVIRYIAAYDPEKKRMTSKSFYTELMNSRNPNLIPWVNRHTAESWRERVRKRISPFRLRIDAYIHERIDRSLCTREEREDGTFPAGLRREPEKEGSEAALPKSPIQADTLSAASTTGGTVREITTEKTASPDKSITKRKRQNSETVTGEIKNATVNKKQKINRKGMMPIDSQLQASPPSAGDAGSSRRSNERRNSGRLKPQKSVEDDVFDNHWDSPNSDAPANEKAKKIAKRQQATQKAKAVTKQYLAPASSPPVDEFLKRTNSIIALEEAIEDAIQEESEADGDPDTDDAELENDLHRNIKRNQGQVDRTEVNRDSSDIHPGRTRNDTQATGMTLSTPPISQVPDTQAPITHPSEGDVTQLMRTRNRVQREHITDLPVTMTGRIHLDSVQIQGLPVTVHAALGQVQPLTVNPSKAVGSIALASSINPNGQDGKERTTAQGQGSVDEQTVRAHVALNSVSSVQARNAHAQTEEEKRDELKRIVVGLVQEYDLNYTAVHRLIQECRKRYQHVNQTLLRGMIEQALAASAQE